jgi:signal transduction histidine kinase
VSIAASRTGTTLTIEVADDGPGWPADGATNGNGIGLTNVRDRLRVLYGDAQRVEIKSGDGGACVTISIPFRSAGAGG